MKDMILRIAVIAITALSSAVCPGVRGEPVQLTQTGVFLRSTIETYPEAEGRPILRFLDQGRVVADAAARDMVAGRTAEVIGRLQETAKATGQTVDTAGIVEQFHAAYGTVTSVEFRSQAIVGFGSNPDVHDLTSVLAATFYAVRTTKYPTEGLYLQIAALRLNGEARLSSVSFSRYVGNVPPWLKPAETRGGGDGEKPRSLDGEQ